MPAEPADRDPDPAAIPPEGCLEIYFRHNRKLQLGVRMETLELAEQGIPVDPVLVVTLQPLKATGGNHHHMQGLTSTRTALQQGDKTHQRPAAMKQPTTPSDPAAEHGEGLAREGSGRGALLSVAEAHSHRLASPEQTATPLPRLMTARQSSRGRSARFPDRRSAWLHDRDRPPAAARRPR